MKYLSAIAFGFSVMVFGIASAQSLPAGGTSTLSVVNMSQGNVDATTTAAKPGDVLRYSLRIQSQSEDVKGFVAKIDVGGILSNGAVLIDTQNAVQNGNTLVYPEYNAAAPCEQEFVFVTRIKECSSASLSASSEGKTASVATDCAAAPAAPQNLTKVGPGLHWFVVGVLVLFGLLCIAVVPRSRT